MRFATWVVTLSLCAAFLPHNLHADDPKPCVVGYLPEYRLDSINADTLKPLTHLVAFSIEPRADGTLPEPVVSPTAMKSFRAIQKASDCKLLLCVGGWGRSDGFASLAGDDALRARFIKRLHEACEHSGFDGVDYDWEHPENDAQMQSYQTLLVESARRFHQSGRTVTVAQAGWQNIGKRAYEAIDRVHLMAYDHDFPQATFDKAKADVDRLVEWGCPANKIVLGLPFYGRNRDGDSQTYAQLVNSSSFAPDTDIVDGFAFNSKATILKKLHYVRTNRLAGVMIWEVGQDPPDRQRSLLHAIGIQLAN